MPHVRKPSRVTAGQPSEQDKVDEANEEQTVAGLVEEQNSEVSCELSALKQVSLKKKEDSESGKGCVSQLVQEESSSSKTPASDSERSTTVFVTSVENYPTKDKKVKFVETKASTKYGDYRKPFHGPKLEKHKSLYPPYKTETKGVLPLPVSQPGELVVTGLGEIAVITDLVPDDPISACLPCLEANGTYICTPCNPRCFIIQKVTTSPTGSTVNTSTSPTPPPVATSSVPLNPDADAFEGSSEVADESLLSSGQEEMAGGHLLGSTIDTPSSEITDPPWPSSAVDFISDSYAYMNGDVGKLPSGVVFSSTSDPLASSTSDYSSLNGVSDSMDQYEGGVDAGETTSTGAASGAGLPSPTVPAQDTAGMPLEQLKQMLSSQLEYYFSRENLANDAYLISQMDNDQYVPIWTVANFNQVKKLTTDIKLITEVLRESPNVQVDEEGQRVRPNHKRCIVILREIPDSTPLDDVKNLFSGEGCPKLISCEFAHNNSWYVTFESDEDAQRAYRFLREEVKEFQGKPIMARIKAKPMNRLPLPPVAGASIGPLKNGYQSPPTAFDPSAAAFQAPAPPPPGQQRFLYSNGSSMPPSVNYSNQVHVYAYQQPNQPFYPPTMLQPWGAANTYFDIGSVFSVNGLAPQQSFSKPSNARFVPRPRGNKRPQGSPSTEGVGSATTGPPRQHLPVGMSPVVAMTAAVPLVQVQGSKSAGVKPVPAPLVEHNHSSTDASDPSLVSRLSDAPEVVALSMAGYRQLKENMKEPNLSTADRHRRRRKEEEALLGLQPVVMRAINSLPASSLGKPANSTSPQPLVATQAAATTAAPGVQFDLQATAFPPLPGLEDTALATKPASVETSSTVAADSAPQTLPHWGENRLADVVKGTAKSRGTSTKDKEEGSASPRAASPSPAAAAPPPCNDASTASAAGKTVPTTPAAEPKSQVQDKVAVDTSSHTSKAELTTTTASPSEQRQADSEVAVAPPAPLEVSVATNTNILTPPPSPIKCVVPVAKCMTADKSTKTDDILLNGEGETSVGARGTERTSSQSAQPPTTRPATVNAATMTNCTPAPSPSLDNLDLTAPGSMDLPPRLSYAQVAQHHKEKAERLAREKHNSESDKDKERKQQQQRETSAPKESRADKRETGEGFREVTSRSTGRALARQAQNLNTVRRQERVPRTQLRPRSPK